ncbi:hypothetical protein VTN77DRAFT_4908 [Rasamsonia byssochlamydoides]|uniref:uncharacterized protein n=1 Tax=Rasamsonia byssochlamydoides TaxID=89139 RepID=UPI0037439F0F
MPSTPAAAGKGAQNVEDEEEDYMSMTIVEPQGKETFAQRKLRQQREAEARAKVPSKAERAAEEAARRENALSSSILDPSNKGYKMMAKLGFKPGDRLGKQGSDGSASEADTSAAASNWAQARAEPLRLVVKEDRAGIGLENEKKRKFREEVEDVAKKAKAEEGEYRERMRLEREERRTEAQVHAAQKVAEKLDLEAEEENDNVEESKSSSAPEGSRGRDPNAGEKPAKRPKIKPTSKIPVLYRGLVREREERERDLLRRRALETSLPSSFVPNPRLPGYEDDTLDRDDKHAVGLDPHDSSFVEQELEEEDPELDEFNALDAKERLRRLVMYLREKHRYCFWCKYRYETDEMEGCPGVTEEDHD